MKFTAELPTKAGAYWWKLATGDFKAILCEVSQIAGDLRADFGDEDEHPIPVDEYRHGLWSGPLLAPEECVTLAEHEHTVRLGDALISTYKEEAAKITKIIAEAVQIRSGESVHWALLEFGDALRKVDVIAERISGGLSASDSIPREVFAREVEEAFGEGHRWPRTDSRAAQYAFKDSRARRGAIGKEGV